MKAHIPLRNKLTKQTRKDMLALVEQELSKKQFGFTRRLFKAFWEHLDRVVIDELGIEFEREEVNEDGDVIQ